MKEQKPVIILGAGGHATVLIELLQACFIPILGLVAPSKSLLKNYPAITYLGDDKVLESQFSPESIKLVNGVGAICVAGNLHRKHLFELYKRQGYDFATLVHPSALVASTVTLQEGAQVMAGVILQPNVFVGTNSIINTRASIDHDSMIENNVHIAPGAILCGNVIVQEGAHIGVGANIIQGITIEKQAMVNAGTTVIRNVLASKLPFVAME